MNCLAVRDLLPELALGVLPARERADVERHLRWCAGCRKESSDFGRSAATLAYALAPARTPAALEDRVVERVRKAARPKAARRLRTTAAAIVAATIAAGSLGWGAVMAGRADRLEVRAAQAQRAQAAAIATFQQTLNQIIPGERVSADEARLGQLSPPENGVGGGFVLALVSPTTIDFTMVIVNGLDPQAADRLPYRVQLFNAAGDMLRGGRIVELNADGGAEVFRQYDHEELTGYTTVRIVDAEGAVVLAGRVSQS